MLKSFTFSCITCEKHVYDKQDGILCNRCNLWTVRWCHMVSKLEDECLTEKSIEPWYSRKKNLTKKTYSKVSELMLMLQ